MESKGVKVNLDVGESLLDVVHVELLVLCCVAVILEAALDEDALVVR